MKKVSRLFLITALGALALCGCGSTLDDSGSSSSTDNTSSSEGTRPTVTSVLQKFSAHNATNTVIFRYLSNSDNTSSTISPASPLLTVNYASEGFLFNFTNNWPSAGFDDYGFMAVPKDNSRGTDPGIYRYTVGTDASSQSVALLGEKETSMSSLYQGFEAYTPQYLYDNALRLGSLFQATSRTEYNTLNPSSEGSAATQGDVDGVAKALNVYGILTGADSAITIHHIDLYYTASTSVYTFTFYVDYNGQYAANGTNFPIGAFAKIGKFGTTLTPKPIANYLK